MKQIKLGNTDLEVSEVCLGADGFGSKLPRELAFQVLDRFRDGGGNFIDTANIYVRDFAAGYSLSERILGEYLRSRGKDSLIIATKGAHPNPKTMHTSRISHDELSRDIDESLDSLGLDALDFYWLHRDNPDMPIGEIIELMEGFVREGKIRYYGGSNYSVDRVSEGMRYAAEHHLRCFSAISNMWSPAVQNAGCPLSADDTLVCFDDSKLDVFRGSSVAFVPYNSTAKGWFAKRANRIRNERLDSVFENATNLALLSKLEADAKDAGISVQTALLRHIGKYPVQIVPVTSVSKIEQLDDLLSI